MSFKKWLKNLLTPASVKQEIHNLKVSLSESNYQVISAHEQAELKQIELEECQVKLEETKYKLQKTQSELMWHRDEMNLLERALRREKEKASNLDIYLESARNKADDFECQVEERDMQIQELNDQVYSLQVQNDLLESDLQDLLES